MSYDEEGAEEERGFKLDEGDEDLEPLEPLDVPEGIDFGDDDPDNRYH